MPVLGLSHLSTTCLLPTASLLIAVNGGPASAQQIWERAAVLPVVATPDMRITRDLVYSSEASDARMDVYVPDRPESGALVPFVLFIHGGPLPENLPLPVKEMAVFQSYARHLGGRGVGAVVFSHRFTSLGAIQQSERDIAAALRYLRTEAEVWGLDRSRMCVWAVSAGGIFLRPFLSGEFGSIRCIILYYTVMDADIYPELGLGPIPEEVAGGYRPQVSNGSRVAPILVARAGKDWEALNRELDRFVAEALAADTELELLNHPTGVHAFDVLTDDDISRRIIERTLEFARIHLLPES